MIRIQFFSNNYLVPTYADIALALKYQDTKTQYFRTILDLMSSGI